MHLRAKNRLMRVGPILSFWVAAMMLAAAPHPARSATDPYRETALSLARRLVKIFPPAEGFVVSVPAGEVYVDLADDQLMRPGMELLVYREGSDIVHPVTGDVLGKYEERLGYLNITEVQEKYSVGKLVPGAAEIRPGDRVRISARPLRALLFFATESKQLDTDRLARELAEAAGDSQRFRLQDEPEWLPRLEEMGMTVDEALAGADPLRRLGEQARADLVFLVSPGKEEPVITLKVLSLWTGRTLAEIREVWRAPAAPASFAGVQGTPSPSRLFPGGAGAPSRQREYSSKELPTAALSILAGNLRGEGALDIFVTDGRRSTLYSWEEGGLIWKWEDKGTAARHVLNVEAGDLDGDGKEELLVTTVKYGQLETEILTWGLGEWDSLGTEEMMFYRLLEGAGGRIVILGQHAGSRTVFSGPVREYSWEEGSFSPTGERTLPRGVDIFGLGLADVDGDGTAEILSLGDKGKIRVFSGEGELVYESRERFGGYPARVRAQDIFGPRTLEGGVTQGAFTNETPLDGTSKDARQDILTAFQGRVLHGGGGLVVVPRNFSGPGKVLPNLRQFDKGETILLQWEDGRLVEVLRSSTQEGFVSDVALGDTDGDGRPEVLMAVNRLQGPLLRKKGTLVVWSYPVQDVGAGAGE